jgi:hypothetical protein
MDAFVSVLIILFFVKRSYIVENLFYLLRMEVNSNTIIYLIPILIILLRVLKRYFSGPTFNTSAYDLKGKYAVVTGGNSGIGK